MQTHVQDRHSRGTLVAIFVLAVATAFWCVAMMLSLLAHLRWESVLWASMSRGGLFFSASLASIAALYLFTRGLLWRRSARVPSLLPFLWSVAIGVGMVGAAWFFLIVPADTMLPAFALLALIGTVIGFESREIHVGQINPSTGGS